jgi:arylsulfatase A-like enzyme
MTGTVDIAPTVLEAAGIPPDPAKPPLDGRSLLSPNTRKRILLEYWREGPRRWPTWASVRTRSYQYTEYYADDAVTRVFREYYRLRRDPWQLRNLLHDGDPRNNPNVRALAAQLARDRRCRGTETARPCP